MTTQEKIELLVKSLNENPLFADQKLANFDKDGIFYISINGDYFYDKICGNGRMPGFTTEVKFNNKGVIVNITTGNHQLRDAISQVFGEETYKAYRNREHWYFSDENPFKNDYAKRMAEYNKMIEEATI